MRLQREARVAVERGDLFQGKRFAFGVVKGFNECPLNPGYVFGKACAPSSKVWILLEPLRKMRAEVAQRERAAGMLREICDRHRFEGPGANNRTKRWKIFGKRAQHA